MRKLSSLLLALMASITFANATVYNGTCGSKLNWSLNTEDSTLTITGSGAMNDYISAQSPWWNYRNSVKYATLPSGITKIGNYAFYSCKKLVSIGLPSGTKTIGDNAFMSCYILESVTLPSSLTTIGRSAFSSCKKLSSINFPQGLVTISPHAFASCVSLPSVNLPASVKSIGDGVFGLCSNIDSINVSENNTNYSSVDGILFNKSKNQLLIFPPARLGNYIVPENVTYIEEDAFQGCRLDTIVLPNGITKILWATFYSSKNLKHVEIPNSVIEIEGSAFNGCSGMESITIPSSVTSIGGNAFIGCSSLRIITCLATTPPTLDVAIGFSNKQTLYVPQESVGLYRAADQWNSCKIRPIGCKFVLQFNDWNGSAITYIYVFEDTEITPPADPTRTGYTFIGWDKDFSNVSEDMTITALYEINRYKVDFLDMDGTILKTDSVTYLYPAVPPADPERTGYTFTGWDKTVNEVVQDTTITALYDINYYPVVLLGHDGKLLSKQTVAYKHAAQQPEVPAREGYTFSGWSTDIESILDSTYAIALYDKIGGTVTYLSEAGDVIASENVDLHLPAAPVIAGKSFKGWLTESADSESGIVLRATYTSDNPTTGEDVTVTPSSNSADVTFPFITGALTYELVIRDLSCNVVCKIMFNSFGQLLGIAFAPSRNRNQQATQSTGFNFTVEGLNASTTYNYEFVAYDETDDAIETLSGSFTTTADTPTNIDNQQSQITNRKYIESGHLFIDNNDRTFDALGQQVK